MHAVAEIYDPSTGTFSLTGSLNEDRSVHAATLLPNGLVLITGGTQTTTPGFGVSLRSAELYDPTTGTFTLTGSTTNPAASHTATLLQSGKVLIVGLSFVTATELYDPTTGTFSLTGDMSEQRMVPTATLLPNGQVLVAGGLVTPGFSTTNSAELYDPLTGTFSETATMNAARQQHTATLLANGQVLVTGGFSTEGSANVSSAELFSILRVHFLVIDEDSIDNSTESIQDISFNAPFCGGLVAGVGNPGICVNDEIADPGVRAALFSRPLENPVPGGTTLVLPTGRVGDEALFRFGNPDPQVSLQGTPTFSTQEFITATGAAADENNLDKIVNVLPLGEAEIAELEGKTVCAVVYDSDIGWNTDPPYGNLKGATLGLTAFRVTAINPNPNGGSNLPLITVELVSSDEVQSLCESVASL